MFETLGGKHKRFDVTIVEDQLIINKVDHEEDKTDKYLKYKIDDIFIVLNTLYTRFGKNWFPLANNVKTMGDTEKEGLGEYLLRYFSDRKLAQGASQLAVLLVESNILKHNGAERGIEFQFLAMPISVESLSYMFSKIV